MKKLALLILIIFVFGGLQTSSVKAVGSYAAGSLLVLEGTDNAAVYYVGSDGMKYVFPDSKTYNTWNDNFDYIVQVSISELDKYPDGGIVTYRPGTKLITHTNTAKIYAVGPGGMLHWIPTAEIAEALYGQAWHTRVIDVIPGYFSSGYIFGFDLSGKYPEGTLLKKGSAIYYVQDESIRHFNTQDAFEYNNFNYSNVIEVDDLLGYSNGEAITGEERSLSGYMVAMLYVNDPPPNDEEDPTPDPDPVDNDTDNDGYDSTASGGTDCNDNNSAIHPGATDICGNGIDEDCSGADLACPVDNDTDNDGYDSAASGGNDCNDSNASINPGITDICGNGIDEDCSGADLSCPPPATPGEPSISLLSSDNLMEGQTITISGSDFGSKSIVEPWIWDDLTHSSYQNLNDGDWIPTVQGGSSSGHYSETGQVTDPDALYGHASGWLAYRDSHPQQRVPGRALYSCEGRYATIFDIGRPHGDTERMYLDYWFYSTSARTGGGGDQFNKIFRISPSTSSYNRYGHTSVYPGRLSYSAGASSPDNPGEDTRRVYEDIYPVEGEWSHISVWTDGSGGLNGIWGDSNGIVKIWTDNIQKINITDEGYGIVDFPDDVMGFSFLHALGIEGGNSPEGHAGFDNLWGDIYIDNTLARVVIGDAATWDQVSHFELQIPRTTWSDSSIDITANLGSFTAGESLYLFVIDENGNASAGYPVTS